MRGIIFLCAEKTQALSFYEFLKSQDSYQFGSVSDHYRNFIKSDKIKKHIDVYQLSDGITISLAFSFARVYGVTGSIEKLNYAHESFENCSLIKSKISSLESHYGQL